MKTILKSLIIFILTPIMLLLLYFIFDNLAGIIVGSFPRRFDFKDWWYEIIRYRILDYLVATSMLSGFYCLIYETTVHYITNQKRFVLGILIGCVCTLVLTMLYWKFIQDHCYGIELSTIEAALSISYGNSASQVKFWMIYSGVVFIIGIFTNRSSILAHNNIRKVVLRQVFGSDNTFCIILYESVPYVILISGTYFLVGLVGIRVKEFFIILSSGGIFWNYWVKLKKFTIINNYYERIANKLSKTDRFVIVQESKHVQESFFPKYLLNTNILEILEKKDIYFVPREIGFIPDNFIKLDVYDEWMSFRTKAKQKQIFNSMLTLRGSYNLAFATDSLSDSAIDYDGEFTDISSVLDEIVRLSRYLHYKRIISHELNNISIAKSINKNCIIDEISVFKRRMETMTDDFLIFDYAVKWLEIVNYLFALIAISKSNLTVTEAMLDLLDNADFTRWREIIDNSFDSDNELQATILTIEDERIAFDEFKKIWNVVTSGKYMFKQYTVKELLYGANKLRDYTRGHGVYTFTISHEITIELIRILVFIINHLIDFLNSAENLDNLEKLGWVVYSGMVPYYLYSIDRRYKEFKYESFLLGKSISLPLEIRR